MNELIRELNLLSQQRIQLIKGDITTADTEVIVNPANSHLMHGGGLAGLLAQKAGPTLQRESTAWVNHKGPVSHEAPAYTGAGELPFQYIIHAVGPVWGSGQEDQKLQDAVQGSLKLADQLNVTSIALPAISTGIFGYPLEPAARVMISAIKGYLLSNPESKLATVQLVLYGDQTTTAFQTVWDQSQT
jgi:O-acetyl-ADP-ribose deacetylase (regulator of RNase III)